jgi:hypothetical protein
MESLLTVVNWLGQLAGILAMKVILYVHCPLAGMVRSCKWHFHAALIESKGWSLRCANH